jgi:type I restriction enzyme S subunit
VIDTSWPIVSIKDVCESVIDCVNKTAPVVNYETPYKMIRTTNVKKGVVSLVGARFVEKSTFEKWTRRTIPRVGDVILTREAPLGDVGMITTPNQNIFLGQRLMQYRVDPAKLNAHYLLYALQGPDLQGQLKAAGAGSTVEHIRVGDAENLKIKLPSIEIQNSIGHLLAYYDNLIENNNRRIAILEDMAQSLYREWFVNFRYPGHTDAVDKDGNQRLIDSPLGQIPEGWEVKRLDDYVTLQRGFDLPKKRRNEGGGIPIYAASGLTGYHDQIKAKGPGIVTGRSGTLGIVKLVLEDHWPLNTSLWVKEFKGCTAHYAYYLLDGIGLERFNSGASVPTLNRNDVHGNPVIAPPKDLIGKFESIVCVNHKQINILKRKNENLKQQRDMLLPKLISGQIELKD